MPRNHTSSSQRHLKFNQNKLFGCFPRKLSAFLYPPSPHAPPRSAMKWCLHGCDVSISTVPSPDATCFYYNRLVPLAGRPFIKNIYSCIPACSYLCCCFSPSLPLHVASLLSSSPLSWLMSSVRARACVQQVRMRIQSEQMHFSGSGAFTIRATPGNYHPKTPPHNTSINVTYRRHLTAPLRTSSFQKVMTRYSILNIIIL